MSTNTVDISNSIKTRLLTVGSINAVYDYVPAQVNKYPFIALHLVSVSGEFADNKRNERVYKYVADLYIDRTAAGWGNDKAEQILRSIVDGIVTLFDNDTTLSQSVQWVEPLLVETEYSNSDIGDTRLARISFAVHKVVDSA